MEFKAGDKVKLIKNYHVPNRYSMNKIYTLKQSGFDLYIPDNNGKDSGDFINHSASGYFELVEDIPVLVTKKVDEGWGF